MAGEINWLPGAVSRYESFWSIGAKFCFFNCVQPNDFIEFVNGLNQETFSVFPMAKQAGSPEVSVTTEGMDAPYEEDTYPKIASSIFSPIDHAEFNLVRLARALDEPVRLVREALSLPLLPRSHKVAGHAQDKRNWTRALRYCPRCAREGYHAVFHQLPWFGECLIHAEALKEVSGKPEKAASRQRFDDTGEHLITALLLLKAQGDFKLSFASLTNLNQVDSLTRFSRIDGYVGWLRKTDKRLNQNTLASFHHDFNVSTKSPGTQTSEYLHFMHRLVPGPPEVIEVLVPCRLSGAVSISRYCVSVFQQRSIVDMLTGQPDFLLRSLLELRLVQCRLAEESPHWHVMATKAMHAMCQLRGKLPESDDDQPERERTSSGGFRIRYATGSGCLALVQQFQRHWNCGQEGADYEATELMKFHAAQHMASIGILAKTGLVHSVTKSVSLTNYFRQRRETEMTCWEPIPALREVCDAILGVMVTAAAWLVFQESQKQTQHVPTLDFWNHSLQPCLMLSLIRNSSLELKVGWRTEQYLPIFGSASGKIPLESSLAA